MDSTQRRPMGRKRTGDSTAAGLGARITGGLLVAATVLVNGAFIGLGSIFSYPQILEQPAGRVLERFTESAGAVSVLFVLLAVGAALLAPIAVGATRLAGASRWSRTALVAGIAAAIVQVVGLLRWPLLVPGLAATANDPAASAADRAAAQEHFTLLGTVLGRVVGESGGYLATAAFTVALLLALRERFVLPRIGTVLAAVSVPMMLMGLLVPLGLPGASMLNFAGYVLWSLWSVSLGVRLLRTGTPGPIRRTRSTPARRLPVPVPAS